MEIIQCSNSLKVSFELNSIDLELSYYFPGSRTRHDSVNQTRFQILKQGWYSHLHDLLLDEPSHILFNKLSSFVFHCCCYFAEFYQVGKDDKLHIQESPAKYTEQKKKRNNYISLNFEQPTIQSEIIAFSTSALDIRLPNARSRFSF